MESEYLRNARRKARGARDYFDDDGDDSSFISEKYQISPQGLSNGGAAAPNATTEAPEIDPLDAFMMGINAQVSQENAKAATSTRPIEKPSRFEDDHDSFMEELARTHKKPRSTGSEFVDSDEEVYATAKRMDGDSDDNGDHGSAKKTIEELAPLDHSKSQYESFRKSFYTPHAAITAMSDDDVRALRQELSIATDGGNVPRPIRSFMEVGFDRKMLGQLMKLGLEAPTPIQAQAFPIAMSGRDMIGIAKTGSGKTLAFTLPMVAHVMDQRELLKDEGPIAIVLSPTRELAHQIFAQVKKFLSVYGAHCAAIYGGVGKWDQIQALRKGAEVVVATPGRLIDMIRKKNVRTKRVTFVVLDEADRMFEMGFEPQLRSIMGQIRPDRQTLMFSATFRKRVELLARDVLHDPVKITVGKIGQANEDIHQIAVVLHNHQAKWPWLMANLKRIATEGRVLIFAGSKVGCEEMAKNLNAMQYQTNCLHGDKSQQERNEALAKFKSGECVILVATDVAARGLDVKNVKTVVNYDTAKNIDTHTHRIGRTGRMGTDGFEPGTAYTLLTRNETQFAAQLVYNMDVSGQPVMADLLALAKRDAQFRRGIPARSNTNSMGGAGAAPFVAGGTTGDGASRHDGVIDDEDKAEMQRWNQNQRKSKADQRKGLGFGASFGDGTASFAAGGFHMAFVKGSSSSTPPPKPIQPAQHPPPALPHRVPTESDVPPPPPPPPFRVLTGGTSAPLPMLHRPPPPPPGHFDRIPAQSAQLQSSVQVTTGPGTTTLPIPEPLATSQQLVADLVYSNRNQERDRSRRSRSVSSEQRRDRRGRSRSRGSSKRYRSRSRTPSRSRSRDRDRDTRTYSSRRRSRRSPSRSRSRSRGRYRR